MFTCALECGCAALWNDPRPRWFDSLRDNLVALFYLIEGENILSQSLSA
jgi:hypothetical protein